MQPIQACPIAYDPHEDHASLCQGAEEDARALHEGSLRRVRLGLRLLRIESERAYEKLGFRRFRDYLKERCGFRPKQASRYMKVSGLPLEALSGTDIALEGLCKIATRQAEDEDVLPLIRRAAEGKAIGGRRRGKKDLARSAPSELAAIALAGLLRLVEVLGVLFGKADGRALAHEWARKLDEAMRSLVQKYAAWRGLSAAELWGGPEQAHKEREARTAGCPGLRGEAAERPADGTGIGADRGSRQDPPATPPAAAPAAASVVSPAVQLPAEVLSFRGLFRFFHQELRPGQQAFVQATLARMVRGEPARYRLAELQGEVRPFLHKGHPLKQEMTRLGRHLREPGVAGRRFALYCLLGARLPESEITLRELARADLPAGLLELVRFYSGLLGASAASPAGTGT